MLGEMQSKSQGEGEGGSGLTTERLQLELEPAVEIGSVIEILPICDNKKTYLTLLHFDR